MAELVISGLSVAAGGTLLVEDASLSLTGGELVAVIGENGAGKSSLLSGIIGYQPLVSGDVAVDGRTIAAMTASERARTVSWLPQSVPLAWPIRVRDAVALGRFAHGGVSGKLSVQDNAIVDRTMVDCGLAALAERSTATLSGGELARVHLARCMVTQAPFLLADEPVAALDPRHQIVVMEMLRTLARGGAAVLIILHDLALAARFADRIIAMKQGRIFADGPVVDVMTPEILERLFGVAFATENGRGWVQPVALG
jgi:iron complex transport system ATP-binding protein